MPAPSLFMPAHTLRVPARFLQCLLEFLRPLTHMGPQPTRYSCIPTSLTLRFAILVRPLVCLLRPPAHDLSPPACFSRSSSLFLCLVTRFSCLPACEMSPSVRLACTCTHFLRQSTILRHLPPLFLCLPTILARPPNFYGLFTPTHLPNFCSRTLNMPATHYSAA